MKIERSTEYDADRRTHTVTLTATSAFAHIVTDEAMLRGGELIERQVDELLMRQVRRDALHALDIGSDIDEALRDLRRAVETILRNIEPQGHHLYAYGLDQAFNAATERLQP